MSASGRDIPFFCAVPGFRWQFSRRARVGFARRGLRAGFRTRGSLCLLHAFAPSLNCLPAPPLFRAGSVPVIRAGFHVPGFTRRVPDKGEASASSMPSLLHSIASRLLRFSAPWSAPVIRAGFHAPVPHAGPARRFSDKGRPLPPPRRGPCSPAFPRHGPPLFRCRFMSAAFHASFFAPVPHAVFPPRFPHAELPVLFSPGPVLPCPAPAARSPFRGFVSTTRSRNPVPALPLPGNAPPRQCPTDVPAALP